jgi:ribosome-associated protein
VLLDIGNIVVHIFAPFERDYYQLESLWGHAPVIVKMI